jgi:hypothetical protein
MNTLNNSKYIFLFAFIIFASELSAQTNSHVNTDSLIQNIKSSGIKTYTWSVDQNNSWEDLENSLPKLKIGGISVNVGLMPPNSNSSSTPYGFDFIAWAKEIAKLSLRYSNVKGYEISDFQENVNLGYFTQNYIDSVETMGISINTKLQFSNAGKLHHVFYVDKNANGNASGLSWKNASITISGLNWNIIKGGDSIYVSGGIDSIIYSKEILKNKIINPGYVVITKGKDLGHNGKVIFSQQGIPTPTQTTFQIIGCENIKIINLSFTNNIPDTTYAYSVLRIDHGINNIIDSCHIYNHGNGLLIYTNYTTKLTIENCLIESYDNNLSWAQDGININYDGGGHTIIRNKIILRGTNSFPHIDVLQISGRGDSTNNYQTIFANNFCSSLGSTAGASGGFRFESNISQKLLLYNNIFNIRTKNGSAVVVTGLGSNNQNLSLKLFNNTIYIEPKCYAVDLTNLDTLIIKNNIIWNNNGNQSAIYFDHSPFSTIDYMDIDYNWYYKNGNTHFIEDKELGAIPWASWLALGYDSHCDTNKVIFANILGDKIVDYKTINNTDTGIDLSKYFKTDIQGTLRPQGGTWDKGALENK